MCQWLTNWSPRVFEDLIINLVLLGTAYRFTKEYTYGRRLKNQRPRVFARGDIYFLAHQTSDISPF